MSEAKIDDVTTSPKVESPCAIDSFTGVLFLCVNPFKITASRLENSNIKVALTLESNLPTVAVKKIGAGLLQKEEARAMASSSALHSDISFEPTGYPHTSEHKNAASQSQLNNFAEIDVLQCFNGFVAKANNTANGKIAGKTLYAQIEIPSINTAIYAAESQINTKNSAIVSIGKSAFSVRFIVNYMTKPSVIAQSGAKYRS